VTLIHLAQDRDQLGTCNHGNEPSTSLKAKEFLDYLSDYQLLKKSVLWN